MIAAEVDRFYRQVVRDFIGNIRGSETLVRDLEQQGVYLPQIEEVSAFLCRKCLKN
jgi:hypothetical protein